jgi:hypothetical protein
MADIPITTADTLPRSLGGDREIKRMELVRRGGYKKMALAEDALKEWVETNGYDAVVGVRFLAVPDVYARGQSMGSSEISTEIRFIIYGTAIAW